MIIYIFLPHSWTHRGMCIAVAEDFEDAESMLTEYFEENCKGHSGVFASTPEDPRLKDDVEVWWILEDSYPVGTAERKIIVDFYA